MFSPELLPVAPLVLQEPHRHMTPTPTRDYQPFLHQTASPTEFPDPEENRKYLVTV